MGRSAKNPLDTACCGREVDDLQHLADTGPFAAKGEVLCLRVSCSKAHNHAL